MMAVWSPWPTLEAVRMADGVGRGGNGPQRRRPDRPFVPFERFEDVVVRCGHTEKFGLLPDGKDRFREDRRKKAISRDCKACRELKQQEERQAAEQRKAEKEQRRARDARRAEDRPRGPQSGRLPDGSRFEVAYDASQERWAGTLTVPAPGGGALTFTGSGSGLFPLLSALDTQYRASLGAGG
jgi:hypothetical protein